MDAAWKQLFEKMCPEDKSLVVLHPVRSDRIVPGQNGYLYVAPPHQCKGPHFKCGAIRLHVGNYTRSCHMDAHALWRAVKRNFRLIWQTYLRGCPVRRP